MSKTSIVQYIANSRAEGKTDTEIAHTLLDAGWQMDVINNAMHGEPIVHRNFEPILDYRKQPLKKAVFIGGGIIIFALLILGALYI